MDPKNFNLKENERSLELQELLKSRILVFDGATGTSIQKLNLSAADFGGDEYEGCNEYLLITKPEAIRGIHRAYLEAGADIIETNSFGTTPIVLEEYKLQDKAFELSRIAATIAREEAQKFSTSAKPRFVAGSMGPTTKALSVTGGTTFDILVQNFLTQGRGLLAGGVDLFIIETIQDSLNMKACGLALRLLQKESGISIPIMVSGTIESTGTTLSGQNIEALSVSAAHLQPLSIGINCATGPDFMTDHIRSLAQITPYYVSCMPNAGMPDGEGRYHETPEKMARVLDRFCQEGWVNLIGGCCGTTPDHIKILSQMASLHKPRIPRKIKKSFLSGIDFIEIEEANRPFLVAERTNVIGSKKFRDLITQGQFEEGAEIARKQIKSGASIVDVCMSNPDSNELDDMNAFLPFLGRKVKAPIMIDSTDPVVMEAALKKIQGKAIINSINLENGEERFERIVPLVHAYGASLVVGTIDEDPHEGMGITAERKLQIAERSYRLLTEKFHISPEDIYFDPLVFPVGTGDEKYIQSSQFTLEALREIKKKFPGAKTILGVSNISFGLPPAGREVLNSVFLYHAVKAGLDTAIVNSEKLKRYPTISQEERELAENLLFHNRDSYDHALREFSQFYKEKKAEKSQVRQIEMEPEQRIIESLVEGSKEFIIEDLEKLRKDKNLKPLEIINGPLMAGMAEVGKLFNANQLIVAEVLQSAEVMKTAVSHLENYMEKGEQNNRGTMILATVKGDVHDIGKNLVEIILSNNGYRIIDLGIKVGPETLIEAYEKHKPQFIGLSGLLVKSAQQMVSTAEDLKRHNIDIPLLVGGAALSESFVRTKIAPAYDSTSIYAKDAMNGLEILNNLSNPETRGKTELFWKSNPESAHEESAFVSKSQSTRERKILSYNYGLKAPSDLKIHVLPGEGTNCSQLFEAAFKYINSGMLYKKHLGFRGSLKEAMAEGQDKYLELEKVVRAAQDMLLNDPAFCASAVYGFFRAASQNDQVVLLSSDGKNELARIPFPRQESGERLCASDFLAPLHSGLQDYMGLLVTSSGRGIHQKAEELKKAGSFLLSHTLQALALESAEGLAEWLHQKMRTMWGWPDPKDWTLDWLFQTKFQGIRLSFGYPACPELAHQKIFWDLLRPDEKINVKLTEGFMMDPEASVSALVFQHPDGKYFSVK